MSTDSNELPKAYEAKIIDSKWYHFWEENNFFMRILIQKSRLIAS